MINNLKRTIILLVLTISGFAGVLASWFHQNDVSVPLGVSLFLTSFFGKFLYDEFKSNDSNPI